MEFIIYNHRMWLRRPHRLATVLLAVLSLLFMQMAVAAYDCPMRDNVAAIAAMAEAGMPCAGDMSSVDLDQPALCHAHCQSMQQTIDKVKTPGPDFTLALAVHYTVAPVQTVPTTRPAQAPLLERSPRIPLSVRHCCLRL